LEIIFRGTDSNLPSVTHCLVVEFNWVSSLVNPIFQEEIHVILEIFYLKRQHLTGKVPNLKMSLVPVADLACPVLWIEYDRK
jgi:hypothetical protein